MSKELTPLKLTSFSSDKSADQAIADYIDEAGKPISCLFEVRERIKGGSHHKYLGTTSDGRWLFVDIANNKVYIGSAGEILCGGVPSFKSGTIFGKKSLPKGKHARVDPHRLPVV